MTASSPHVAILMATYNGVEFLEAQLDSLLEQTHDNWSLWISDDGSTEGTIQCATDWAARHPNRPVHIRKGPGKGAAHNFLSLLIDTAIEADFYAFCDQDDVWFPDKLTNTLSMAPEPGGRTPFLYGARTIITNTDLRQRRKSFLVRHELCFTNALVQNFAGGNTMVFNAAARSLVPGDVAETNPVAHDWLMYQLVAGVDGDIVYDSRPCLYYRQHNRNEIGSNLGLRAKTSRVLAVMNGRYRRWNACNFSVLFRPSVTLAPANRKSLESYRAATGARYFRAAHLIRESGVWRREPLGTASLYAAAFLGLL